MGPKVLSPALAMQFHLPLILRRPGGWTAGKLTIHSNPLLNTGTVGQNGGAVGLLISAAYVGKLVELLAERIGHMNQYPRPPSHQNPHLSGRRNHYA